jgi:protein-S-isoprenylcysteine O-methyltransferase Ste14
MSEPKRARVLPLFTDLIFVILAFYFLVGYARSFFFNLQLQSSFLLYQTFFMIYLITALALLVMRKSMVVFSSRISDYVFTLVALLSPMFFRPVIGWSGSLVGDLFVLVGAVLTVGAILSLNNSFGIGPENRGIKSNGMYRIVRHPMYSGYVLTETGFVLSNFSPFNLLVFAVASLFLVLRLQGEERLLKEDTAYQVYAQKTRWKLLPLLF